MMDPKKYDELIEQEEYFSEKYGFVISVDHTNGPDSHYFTDREIHNVAMTVFGDTYVVRNHLVFRSDAKGAFYKQVDAITSARIQLVDYFKVYYHHLDRCQHMHITHTNNRVHIGNRG